MTTAATDVIPTDRSTGWRSLYLLGRTPSWLVAIVGVIILAAVTAAGIFLYHLQQNELAQGVSGVRLNSIASTVADGSTWATIVPGWLAAVFFALTLPSLRSERPEPPASKRPLHQQTVSQLRAGLRREYTWFRIGAVIVTLLAAVDASRTIVTVLEAVSGAASLAAGQIPLMLAESAGYLVCAGIFVTWVRLFQTDLERWGAL